MIGLLQRVSHARVQVGEEVTGEIGAGLLVLVGIERGDGREQADSLLRRLLAYRVFPDAGGRMNLGLKEAGGGLLLVPQFTLAADTEKGLRPSFTPAAPPEEARLYFDYLVSQARECYHDVASGRFGSDMSVQLVNEGPVTFWLRASPGGAH